MAVPIEPSRSASAMPPVAQPPVAQLLAEAALQRQSALLGADTPRAGQPPALPTGQPTPGAPAAMPLPAAPGPRAADTPRISPQAREQFGAGFDLQRNAARGASAAHASNGANAASGSAARAAPAGEPAGAPGDALPGLQ
ncbi:MAG: hypothetical protein ACK5OA_08890, partial [Acidovorax sp.]